MIALREARGAGDLGTVVRLHGELYAAEHGFDRRFEAYVAEGVGRLALTGGGIWLADRDGTPAGCVAMGAPQDGAAQLRYLLVAPAARGAGLGGRLLDHAVAWAREQGAERVFLWTVAELEDAARLYRGRGFTLAEERPPAPLWGPVVRERRYERRT